MNEFDELLKTFTEPNAIRSIVILFALVFIIFWLSRFVSKFIIFIIRKVAQKSDNSSDIVKSYRFRRLETYLSTLIAVIRVAAAAIIAYLLWQVVSPASSAPVTLIGASALFIVLAGGMIGPLLNDFVSGFTMIIERWYSVGDYIRVEPFIDAGGVVERVTLRSTKLRSISGEVVWLHNRTIHGVHVTPYGVRSISVEVFANDAPKAEKIIKEAIATLPLGATVLTKAPVISASIQVTDKLWRIVIDTKTAPGREWLIENFFVASIKELNNKRVKPVIVHEPIVRFVDADAEKGFRRAVQLSDKEYVKKKKRSSKKR